MPESVDIQNLDDRTVLRIVSHLTEQLREEMSDEESSPIQSANEARSAVASLLESSGVETPIQPSGIITDEAAAAEQGRALLQLFWEDETMRPKLEELLAHPPEDSQKSVELAIATAVILGGLITWLQTHIEIEVKRNKGKTEFSFKLRKEKTGDDLIKKVIEPVSKIISTN
jgi:hypothetical protein